MKVRVAPDLCCGAQRCWEVAPDFYTLRDGFSAFVGEESHDVPPGREDEAVRGAEACPESAIEIMKD